MFVISQNWTIPASLVLKCSQRSNWMRNSLPRITNRNFIFDSPICGKLLKIKKRKRILSQWFQIIRGPLIDSPFNGPVLCKTFQINADFLINQSNIFQQDTLHPSFISNKHLRSPWQNFLETSTFYRIFTSFHSKWGVLYFL